MVVDLLFYSFDVKVTLIKYWIHQHVSMSLANWINQLQECEMLGAPRILLVTAFIGCIISGQRTQFVSAIMTQRNTLQAKTILFRCETCRISRKNPSYVKPSEEFELTANLLGAHIKHSCELSVTFQLTW